MCKGKLSICSWHILPIWAQILGRLGSRDEAPGACESCRTWRERLPISASSIKAFQKVLRGFAGTAAGSHGNSEGPGPGLEDLAWLRETLLKSDTRKRKVLREQGRSAISPVSSPLQRLWVSQPN